MAFHAGVTFKFYTTALIEYPYFDENVTCVLLIKKSCGGSPTEILIDGQRFVIFSCYSRKYF